MSKRKIIVASTIPNIMEVLKNNKTFIEIAGDAELIGITKGDVEKINLFEGTSVILGDPDLLIPYFNHPQCEHYFRSVEWIQGTYAGAEKVINIPYIKSAKCQYTRLAGVFGTLMSEFCLGYIIALERDFFTLHKQQQSHTWKRYSSIRPISTLTIGILGIGDIGEDIASTLKHFKATVWGYCTNPDKKSCADRVFVGRQGLETLLAGCDYIISVLPHTEQTRGLLSGNTLSLCKPTAVFINVGRGTVIAESCLVNALRSNWIRGAVLDVFEKEPLPPESELWDMENVKITPHVSANSMASFVSDLFVDNLSRFLKNQPLFYTVDIAKGY